MTLHVTLSRNEMDQLNAHPRISASAAATALLKAYLEGSIVPVGDNEDDKPRPTTLSVDDDLVAKAVAKAGGMTKTTLLRQLLRATQPEPATQPHNVQ